MADKKFLNSELKINIDNYKENVSKNYEEYLKNEKEYNEKVDNFLNDDELNKLKFDNLDAYNAQVDLMKNADEVYKKNINELLKKNEEQKNSLIKEIEKIIKEIEEKIKRIEEDIKKTEELMKNENIKEIKDKLDAYGISGKRAVYAKKSELESKKSEELTQEEKEILDLCNDYEKADIKLKDLGKELNKNKKALATVTKQFEAAKEEYKIYSGLEYSKKEEKQEEKQDENAKKKQYENINIHDNIDVPIEDNENFVNKAPKSQTVFVNPNNFQSNNNIENTDEKKEDKAEKNERLDINTLPDVRLEDKIKIYLEYSDQERQQQSVNEKLNFLNSIDIGYKSLPKDAKKNLKNVKLKIQEDIKDVYYSKNGINSSDFVKNCNDLMGGVNTKVSFDYIAKRFDNDRDNKFNIVNAYDNFSSGEVESLKDIIKTYYNDNIQVDDEVRNYIKENIIDNLKLVQIMDKSDKTCNNRFLSGLKSLVRVSKDDLYKEIRSGEERKKIDNKNMKEDLQNQTNPNPIDMSHSRNAKSRDHGPRTI